MLLASSLGERAWSEAAAAMASFSLAPGCPLKSLTLLMAGRADQLVQGPSAGASGAKVAGELRF